MKFIFGIGAITYLMLLLVELLAVALGLTVVPVIGFVAIAPEWSSQITNALREGIFNHDVWIGFHRLNLAVACIMAVVMGMEEIESLLKLSSSKLESVMTKLQSKFSSNN